MNDLSVNWLAQLFMPSHKLGDTVWFISHDDNCPATKNGRVDFGVISQYNTRIVKDASSSIQGLVFDSYRLNVFYPKQDFFDSEIYTTKKEAEYYSDWFSVDGVSDKDWMNLIGDRGSIRTEEHEKLIVQLEKLEKPWVRQTTADPIDIEDAELDVCCAAISNVRDLLEKCYKHGGLIRRDILLLANLLKGSGHSDLLEDDIDRPVMAEVFSKLNVDMVVSAQNKLNCTDE